MVGLRLCIIFLDREVKTRVSWSLSWVGSLLYLNMINSSFWL